MLTGSCVCYIRWVVRSYRVKLQSFCKFEDTEQAVVAANAICDGKLDKSLKTFLKSVAEDSKAKLAVSDQKLGGLIKEKLNIKCIYDNSTMELMRGIRQVRYSLMERAVRRQLTV